MKLLFVDDEPLVVEALERMVMELGDDWDVTCSTSGEDALVELAVAPFDVVVSDMRMPGMDGAALLQQVHVRHPQVARFVLSGQTSQDAAMRSLRVAHQFLSKPCKAEVLVAAVERAHALRGLVGNDVVRGLATGVDCLPSLPSAVRELTLALECQNPCIAAVADIVSRDPGMAAKVLQVASSAFFERGAAVADVRVAVKRLGVEVMRAISVDATSAETMAPDVEERVGTLQREAVASAVRAFELAPEPLRAEAYTVALLCDVGQLVLCRGVHDLHRSAGALAAREGLPIHVAERRVLGVTHAEVGAYMLGLWGLPRRIVDTVAGHHGSGPDATSDAMLAAAVRATHQTGTDE